MEPEEVESATIHNLVISVPKSEADFVRSMGFSSFCYISCEDPIVEKIRPPKPKEKKKKSSTKDKLKPSPKNVKTKSLESRSKSNTPRPDPVVKPKKGDKEIRSQVRQTIGEQLFKRCSFHDIEIGHLRCRELAYEVELDLVDVIKSIKDHRYRQWCTMFVKHLVNCGKPFLDKILADKSTIRHLTKLFDKELYNELHRLDEIEAAVADISTGNLLIDETVGPCTSSSLTEPAKDKLQTKVKPIIELPFKRKMLNGQPPSSLNLTKSTPTIPTPIAITSHGRTAVDDILGDAKDTTSKHMSHLFDANCEICIAKSKRQAALLEKEKEKEKLRAEKPKKNHKHQIDRKSSTQKTPPNHNTNGRYQYRNGKRFPTKRRWDFSPVRRTSSPVSNYGDSPEYDDRHMGNSPQPTFSSPRRKRSHRPDSSSWRTSNSDSVPTFSSDRPDTNRRQPYPDNTRAESWRRTVAPAIEPNSLLEQVIWSGRVIYPADIPLSYKCDFIAIRNRSAASNLENELSHSLEVKGVIDQRAVWDYLRTLRENTDNEIITLLMHPPGDDVEYRQYVIMYSHLLNGDRMGVVNVGATPSIKDMYIFSLSSGKALHPLCDSGDGTGLLPEVRKCGNILAVVVRKAPIRLESWKQSQSWAESHTQVSNSTAPPLTPPPPTTGRLFRNGESLRVDMSSNSLESPRPLVICSPEEVPVAKNSPPLTLSQLDEIVNLVEHSPTHENMLTKIENPAEEIEKRRIEAQISNPSNLPSNFNELRSQLLTLKFSRNVFSLAAAFFNVHTVDQNERMEVIRIADSKNSTSANRRDPPPPPPPPAVMVRPDSSLHTTNSPDTDCILPPPPPPPPLQQPRPPLPPSAVQMQPNRRFYDEPPMMNVRPFAGPGYQRNPIPGPNPMNTMLPPAYRQPVMNRPMRPQPPQNFPQNGIPANPYNTSVRPVFRPNGQMNMLPEAMNNTFHRVDAQPHPAFRPDVTNGSFYSLEPQPNFQRRPDIMNGGFRATEPHPPPRHDGMVGTFRPLEPQPRPQMICTPTRGLLLPQPRAGPMMSRPRPRVPRLDSGGFYR